MKASLGEALASVATTAISQALFRWLGYLKLKPLETWHVPSEGAVTYVIAAAAAAVACLWVGKSTKSKIAAILIGLLAFYLFCQSYSSLIWRPWSAEWSWAINLGAMALFFLAYFSYGFVIARIVNVLFAGFRKRFPQPPPRSPDV